VEEGVVNTSKRDGSRRRGLNDNRKSVPGAPAFSWRYPGQGGEG
jgi:hypothetical protein